MSPTNHEGEQEMLSRRVLSYLKHYATPRKKPTGSIESRLRSAERQLARGCVNAGVRQMLDIAEEKTRDLTLLNRMGDALARSGQLEPGIALFERTARAYAEDGFWSKAIAIYKKILRYDPRRGDVNVELALLYQRSGLPTGG